MLRQVAIMAVPACISALAWSQSAPQPVFTEAMSRTSILMLISSLPFIHPLMDGAKRMYVPLPPLLMLRIPMCVVPFDLEQLELLRTGKVHRRGGCVLYGVREPFRKIQGVGQAVLSDVIVARKGCGVRCFKPIPLNSPKI